MEVNKIAAHIRFSKDIGGSWKSVELSAEASVSDREHWKQSQSELYFQLTDQLRQLWHNGNGAVLNGNSGTEIHVEPPVEPEPVSGSREPLEHWCEEHRVDFKRRTKNGTVWYSHRQGSGWCNEPEPAERR